MTPGWPTLFQRSLELDRRSSPRTPRDASRGGGQMAALGAALLAVLAAIALLERGRPLPAWGWVIAGIAAALTVAGLARLGRAWLRPTRRLACPACGAEQQVYDEVRAFSCPTCRTLLLPGPDSSARPALSVCPNCGRQTGVTADHGPFMCPNCGMLRHSAAPQTIGLTQPCPRCERPSPVGAVYCPACGAILFHDFRRRPEGAPDLAYNLDWRSGKDAAGHLHYARALLLDIGPAEAAEDVHAVGDLLTRLMNVLISLEEALQDPALRPQAAAVVPDVDRVYGDLVQRAAALVAAQAADPRGFWKGDLDVLAAEPHILARRRVEELLGPELASGGGIGPWAERLLTVRVTDKRRDRVLDYQRLLDEAARFRDRAEKS